MVAIIFPTMQVAYDWGRVKLLLAKYVPLFFEEQLYKNNGSGTILYSFFSFRGRKYEATFEAVSRMFSHRDGVYDATGYWWHRAMVVPTTGTLIWPVYHNSYTVVHGARYR